MSLKKKFQSVSRDLVIYKMYYFNFILSKLFEALFFPFQSFNPLWPLLFVSAITGILMLLAFRYTSNQKEIKKEKDKIKAHLMEMSLFKDNLAALMSAFINVLRYNARYIKHLIKPAVFLIVPTIFMLIHLNFWFGYRPILTGEAAVLSVKLSNQKKVALSNVEIEVDEGVVVETPPLRILELKEVNWRIRAKTPGTHTVIIKTPGDTFQKKFVVSTKQFKRISPRKFISSFWDTLLYPGEKPFTKDSLVKEIAINYPSEQIEILGWRIYWLVIFFVFSMAAGFAFKGYLNVEI